MRDIDINSVIRQALAGSAAQQPVDATTLHKLGKKDDIDALLGLMLANRELNTARLMKDGVWKTLYWLTGVISPLRGNMLVINRQRMESARDRPPLRTPGAEVRKNVTEVQESVTKVQESATKVQKSATEVKPSTTKMESARDRPPLRTPSADLRTPGAEVRKNATEAHKTATEAQKTVTDVQKSTTEVKPNTAKVVQTAAHQPEQKKEASMNTATTRVGIQPSEMNTSLYNKIVVHPGITQLALIKHAQHKFPDATEKQIKKMLCNLVHSAKKIRSEGKRGKLAYHLSIGVTQPPAKPASPAKPVQPVKKAVVGKVLHGEEGREAAKMAAPSVAKASKPSATPVARVINNIKIPVETPADDFYCLLQDDGSLCIYDGSGDVMLNPDQISRLQRFMTRYQIVQGAPA